jgi:hypothetical protein
MSKRLNDADGSRTDEQGYGNIEVSTTRERIIMREVFANELKETYPDRKFEIVALGVAEDGRRISDSEALLLGPDVMGAADYKLIFEGQDPIIIEVMVHTLSSPTYSVKLDKCQRMIKQNAWILIATESFHEWISPDVLKRFMETYYCSNVMNSGKPGIKLSRRDVYDEVKNGSIIRIKWSKSSRDLLEPLRDVLFIRRQDSGELQEWNTPQRREIAWNMWSLWK